MEQTSCTGMSEEVKLCTQDREAAAVEPKVPRAEFQQEMVIKLQTNQPNLPTTKLAPETAQLSAAGHSSSSCRTSLCRSWGGGESLQHFLRNMNYCRDWAGGRKPFTGAVGYLIVCGWLHSFGVWLPHMISSWKWHLAAKKMNRSQKIPQLNPDSFAWLFLIVLPVWLQTLWRRIGFLLTR